MIPFLVLALIAVAAVAVVTYLNSSSTTPPSRPIETSIPEAPTLEAPITEIELPSIETSIPEDVDTTTIPEEDVDAGPVEEEPTPSEEESLPAEEELESNATEANNAIEDGIHDAYFALEVYEKTGNKQAKESPYSYTFNNNQNFANKTKETVSNEILNLISEELNARNVFAKQDIILQALTASSYKGKNQNNGVGDTIQFHVFEMQPTLQKTDTANLGEDVFVVAKSFNLIYKEATITIHEKDELLVAEGAPLNVIESKENDEDAQELTELKATFDDDGIAKIKIKLRPKSDEDLETWNGKINGGAEDGMHSYEVKGTFTVENDIDDIVNTIFGRSNSALSPSHNVKKEDIKPLLVVGSTYSASTTFTFPKYKKGASTEYLWLNVTCDGEEESHQGEFLKEDGKYFILGRVKAIIFPLLVKPENDTGKKWSNYYWAGAQASSQAAFNSNRRGGRKHAGRDLYTNPKETIVAIAPGKVLSISSFYAQTDQITIHHKTIDNREFIIRYGELDPSTIQVAVNDNVTQGQVLGVTGKLVGITVISGQNVYMIHFEHFTGDKGFNVSGSNSLSNNEAPFKRRSDLIDSLEILEEGYRNTFEENTTFNDWAHSPFGNRIALKESQDNYNLCNRRRSRNDYPMVRQYIITDMTIAQVMALQSDTSVLFATGRYQIVPETLIEGVRMLGLDVNQKYDEAMQDRLFNEYLIDLKRKPIINFLEGSGSVEDAMYASAKEWASIGVEIGRRLSDGSTSTNGQSYYAGIGGNRAHISPDEIKSLLIASKENINN